MHLKIFHLSCAVLIGLLSLNSLHAQTPSGCQPSPPMPPNVKPGVVGFDLSHDGKTLLVAGGDSMIRFVDMTSGNILRTFTGHTNAVYRAIYSHDEKLIASSSRDRTARVWDWTSGRELWQTTGFQCSVKAVVFSPDSRLLGVAGNDGIIKIYEVKSGKELHALIHSNSATGDMAVYSLAFGRESSRIYAANADGTISEWDTTLGKELRTWKAHQGGTFKLVFNSDHTLLASIGGDAVVMVWDIATGRAFRGMSLVRIPEAVVMATEVAFSHDGKLVAASAVGMDADRTKYLYIETLVWSTNRAERLFTLEGNKVDVPALIFTKDDRYLLTGSVDTTIKFWDLTNGKLSRTITIPGREGASRPASTP
jgi:WD40 repeat protein